MTTIILPDGPELPMEQVPLKTRIHHAIKPGLRDLAGTDVSGARWLVFRPEKNGSVSEYLQGPKKRSMAADRQDLELSIFETWSTVC
jgi:hypothetical protein